MGIFKKEKKVEVKAEEPKPVPAKVRQVVAYSLNGELFKTVGEARARHVVSRVAELCAPGHYGYFSSKAFVNNWDKIKAIMEEEIQIIPLFAEDRCSPSSSDS